jgi:predicted RNA-binding Zn-ribbon protein involved in translation (DUF1610 family)
LSNKTLTFESFQEDLQEKFERMKSKKNRKGETAFHTKQVKTRCPNCGKIGHKKESCWELEANKVQRPRNWKPHEENEMEAGQTKTQTLCWKCNQKGYVQMNCPQNKEQKSGMMASEKEASDNEVSFMAINKSTEKS